MRRIKEPLKECKSTVTLHSRVFSLVWLEFPVPDLLQQNNDLPKRENEQQGCTFSFKNKDITPSPRYLTESLNAAWLAPVARICSALERNAVVIWPEITFGTASQKISQC
jgi:hypothetical protein